MSKVPHQHIVGGLQGFLVSEYICVILAAQASEEVWPCQWGAVSKIITHDDCTMLMRWLRPHPGGSLLGI